MLSPCQHFATPNFTKFSWTIPPIDRRLQKGSSPTAANKYMHAVAKHILVRHPPRTWVGKAGPMPTLPYPSFLPTPNTWNPDKTETGRDGDDFLPRRRGSRNHDFRHQRRQPCGWAYTIYSGRYCQQPGPRHEK